MLYETPGAPRENSYDRFDDAIPTKGLGALPPHGAGYTQPSGGGGGSIGVLGVGGGGGTPAGGTVTAPGPTVAPGFRTVGRNQSIFQVGFQRPSIANVRNAYQPSGIAPRASTKGSDFLAPKNPKGAAGLGAWYSHWIDPNTYLPPGGKINRITIIPQTIRNIIPTPIRTAVRYFGAGVQSVFFPVLSAPQQRTIFGLSPKESAVFEKTQQIMLPIDAVIVTAGAAAYLTAPAAVSPAALTPAQSAAMLASNSAIPAAGDASFVSPLAANVLTPAQAAAAISPEGVSAEAGITAAAPYVAPGAGYTGAQASLLAEGFSPAAVAPNLTPVQVAAAIKDGSIPATGGGGFLSSVGNAALGAGKFVGTTAVTTAAQIALQNAMAGRSQTPGQQAATVVGVPAAAGAQGPAVPQYGQSYGGGGATGVPDATPVEASIFTPGVMLGGVVMIVGVAVVLKKKRAK